MKTHKLLFVFLLQLTFYACSQKKSIINAKVTGEGQPIILIPGLACDGSVWNDTTAFFDQKYQCHVLTLPGFSGQKPLDVLDDINYLETIRNEIILYVESNNLKNPIIIGHSLGGFLALQIAIKKPSLPLKLIILDALPYLPAMRNPKISIEDAKKNALNYKNGMLEKAKLPLNEKSVAQRNFLKYMISDSLNIEKAITWYLGSDNKTTVKAMYEMNTTDLRTSLSYIKSPTLILGSWVAGKPYGATKDGALEAYKNQYKTLDNVEVIMSDKGLHFMMWDDPEFVTKSILKFL